MTLLLCLLIVPAALDAQTVRGRVTDEFSERPVTRAFVVLLHAAGGDAVRTLTSADGRYRLTAPAPGRYRLRTEVIGYQVSESDPFPLRAGQVMDRDLAIRPVRVRLAALTVTGETYCRRPEGDTDAGLVWEEARKALAGAAWTAHASGYQSVLHRYRRIRGGSRAAPRREEIWVRKGRAMQPFASREAALLEAHGYVVERNDRRRYFGPDANVLLDDAFHRTHCFTAVRGRDEFEDFVGLAFRPVPDREVPDIAGTLWIDRASAELRRIDYRYEDLPFDFEDDRLGGTIRFRRLRSGAWILANWEIRTPVVGGGVVEVGRREETRSTLEGVQESGGRVIELRDIDGNLEYLAPERVVVHGTVYDSIRGMPAAGTLVSVLETGYSARADSAGRYSLTTLLDGVYELTTGRLDSLGYAPGRVEVRFSPGDSVLVPLAVPALGTILEHLCPGTDRSPAYRVLRGRVRNARTDEALADIPVVARWSRPDLAALGGRSTNQVHSSDDGEYVLCGLPAQRMLEISVPVANYVVEPIEVRFARDSVEIFGLTYEAPGGIGVLDLHIREKQPPKGERRDRRDD